MKLNVIYIKLDLRQMFIALLWKDQALIFLLASFHNYYYLSCSFL